MSRIGKKPIPIPKGVTVVQTGNRVDVKGPKGELFVDWLEGIELEITETEALVYNRGGEIKLFKSRHGLLRSLLANAVTGVSEGFVKRLELHGVGYRAEAKQDGLDLQIGFSHPVFMPYPEGVTAEIEKGTNAIAVSGINKQVIGQYCAVVRKLRPPEPYKGKGFRYVGEKVRRKSGKTV